MKDEERVRSDGHQVRGLSVFYNQTCRATLRLFVVKPAGKGISSWHFSICSPRAGLGWTALTKSCGGTKKVG